jgi:hypothetical protein
MGEAIRIAAVSFLYGVLIAAPFLALSAGPVPGLVASVVTLALWFRVGSGFSLFDGAIMLLGLGVSLGGI